MENYKNLYEPLFAKYISQPWVKKALKESLSPPPADYNISRWSAGQVFPPIEALVVVAEITNTTISYLTGESDIKGTLKSSRINPVNIDEFRESLGMQKTEFATRLGTSSRTANDLVASFPHIRTNSLLAIADAFSVSPDYLLGLTDYETWEQYRQMKEAPFANIKPGEAAYILSKKRFCLLGRDGETVYLSDGKTLNCKDDTFKGLSILPVKPIERNENEK